MSTVSIRQFGFADSGATSPASLTFALVNVLAHNAIDVRGTGPSGATDTCADTVNGSYGPAANVTTDVADGQLLESFTFANSAAAASLPVTITYGVPTGGQGIFAAEIDDVTLAPLDGHVGVFQTAPGTGANAITAGPPSPNNARSPAGLVSLCMQPSDLGSVTPVAGTGFTSVGTGWGFGAAALAVVQFRRVTAPSPASTFTAATGAGAGNYLVVTTLFDEKVSVGNVIFADQNF